MKEFVEKLIGRLEELTYDMEICEEQFDMNSPYFMDVEYKMVKIDDIKEIVNQLAEEYGKDTNVTTNADRIREFSDEELAEFLGEFEVCNVCKYLGDRGECELDSIFLCEKGFAVAIAKDWLQSEVKGSDV